MREGVKTKRNAERMRNMERPAKRNREEHKKNTEPSKITNEMTTKKSDASTGKRR